MPSTIWSRAPLCSASLFRSTSLELLDFVEAMLLAFRRVGLLQLGRGKHAIVHVDHRLEELSTHVTSHCVDCHRRDNNHDNGNQVHEDRGSLVRK